MHLYYPNTISNYILKDVQCILWYNVFILFFLTLLSMNWSWIDKNMDFVLYCDNVYQFAKWLDAIITCVKQFKSYNIERVYSFIVNDMTRTLIGKECSDLVWRREHIWAGCSMWTTSFGPHQPGCRYVLFHILPWMNIYDNT